MDEHDKLAEAEQSALQATFILNDLQANVQVYGSNSAWTGARAADIELGLRYINRALEHCPDNPSFLNTKALLLIDSGHDKALGIKLLERAHEINPRDITIESNLQKSKATACFVATVVYGNEEAEELNILRTWRDGSLKEHTLGRLFVRIYYVVGPTLAAMIVGRPRLRHLARMLLDRVVRLIR